MKLSLSVVGETSESGGRREEGLLPVCTCSLPGIHVPNQHKGTFCQALDYLDGKVCAAAAALIL